MQSHSIGKKPTVSVDAPLDVEELSTLHSAGRCANKNPLPRMTSLRALSGATTKHQAVPQSAAAYPMVTDARCSRSPKTAKKFFN